MAHGRLAVKEKDSIAWTPKVDVVPRGSFISRTALRDSADLDLDFIINDDFFVPINGRNVPIRHALGVDHYNEQITFPSEALKAVLIAIWDLLCNAGAGYDPTETRPGAHFSDPITVPDDGDEHDGLLIGAFKPYMVASNWLELRAPTNEFTRSIPVRTKDKIASLGGKQLDIDIFVKIRTKIRGISYIVGVDKNGPGGIRRYQITDYIPTEGKWFGDRVLGPTERCALIMLKWWKTEEKLPLKSHHLLTALNALYELDPKDDLYLPKKTSKPFSLQKVKKLMRYMLLYLSRAYGAPWNFVIGRPTGPKGELQYDYAFPQSSLGVMDVLFLQMLQEKAHWELIKAANGGKTYLELFADELLSKEEEKMITD